jgi:hypothetical protein
MTEAYRWLKGVVILIYLLGFVTLVTCMGGGREERWFL